MTIEQHTFPGFLVKKSNALIRGLWRPSSIWDSRIVAHVASRVSINDEDFKIYKIPLNEMNNDILPNKEIGGEQYNLIVKSIDNLFKATIKIRNEEKPKNFMQYTIFTKCGYEDGCLIAQFHPDLKMHYLNLKEQFTTYKLQEFLKLNSRYSQKLFELLMSWSKINKIELSLNELHTFLGVPESYKQDYQSFKKRVLDPTYKEISNCTNLKYFWEPVRTSRKITAIKFIFNHEIIEARKKELKIAKQRKTSEKNNKIFKIAVDCAKNKTNLFGKCDTREQLKDICKICDKLELLEETLNQ